MQAKHVDASVALNSFPFRGLLLLYFGQRDLQLHVSHNVGLMQHPILDWRVSTGKTRVAFFSAA